MESLMTVWIHSGMRILFHLDGPAEGLWFPGELPRRQQGLAKKELMTWKPMSYGMTFTRLTLAD